MGHTARRVDLRASNTQNILAKVGTIIAKCTDNLLKAREKDAKKIDLDEMVSSHTDALALLGHLQHREPSQEQTTFIGRVFCFVSAIF